MIPITISFIQKYNKKMYLSVLYGLGNYWMDVNQICMHIGNVKLTWVNHVGQERSKMPSIIEVKYLFPCKNIVAREVNPLFVVN